MNRFLATIFLVSLFIVICATLGRAQNLCYSKDEIIQTYAADGVHYRKVSGGDADALGVYLNGLVASEVKKDLAGFTYIVFWIEKGDNAIVVLFDKANCAEFKINPPMNDVLSIIGGDAGA